jgi:chromosome segregation ATPase
LTPELAADLLKLAGTPRTTEEVILSLAKDKYGSLLNLKEVIEANLVHIRQVQASCRKILLTTEDKIQELTLQLKETTKQLAELENRKPEPPSGVTKESPTLELDSPDLETEALEATIADIECDLDFETISLPDMLAEIQQNEGKIRNLNQIEGGLAAHIPALEPKSGQDTSKLNELNQKLHKTLLEAQRSFHEVTHALSPQRDAIGDAKEGLRKLLLVSRTRGLVNVTRDAWNRKETPEHEPDILYKNMLEAYLTLAKDEKELAGLLEDASLTRTPALVSGVLRNYAASAKKAYDSALNAYRKYGKPVI